MQQFVYKIKDRDGVHARPAGAIIRTASANKSEVCVECHGKKISLKSGIFALMGLSIHCGEDVTVTCEGEDEEVAISAMKDAFEKYL